jgi:Protein of unknown function (DUF4199)
MENNEIQSVTTRSVGLRFGLISAVVSIVLFIIPAVIGQNPFKGVWNWVGMVVGIGIVVFAHKSFKDDGDGFMNYGQGIGIAFWMGLVSTLIVVGFMYVYINFIDANPFELFMEQQQEEMAAKGTPENIIETSTEWTRKLFWPIALIMGLLGSIVIALIVTIFTQKKDPNAIV